jgi:uncharacterized membrane protein
MRKTVLGIFSSTRDAEHAINQLEDNGYVAKDISIVARDREDLHYIADNTGADVADGALSGAATGGLLGGLAGLLIGIGAITIPGIGALLIGGPLATALGLTGAAATTISGAATGALAGGILGALVNLGIPEDEARVYEDRIKEGGILVAIPAQQGREADVREILEDNGADMIRAIEHPEEYVSPTRSDTYKGYDEYAQPGYYAAGIKGGKTKKRSKRVIEDEVVD